MKRAFSARITVRGDTIALSGDAAEVQSLTALFSDFIKMAAAGSDPTIDDAPAPSNFFAERIRAEHFARRYSAHVSRGRAIRPKTAGQKRYVDAIRENTVTFGIGPQARAKPYLAAMAMAVAAPQRKGSQSHHSRAPWSRRGENWAFCQARSPRKSIPHIRPLYDALI